MILDRLQNAVRYGALHPGLAQAFAFLNQPQLVKLPDGRHEILGAQLYATIATKAGRPRNEAKLESHRKYIDIQMVLSGVEEMGWKPTADCAVVQSPYDAAKDVEFFADRPDGWISVGAGQFAIFFPEDAHAPLAGEGEIHKVIVKVAV